MGYEDEENYSQDEIYPQDETPEIEESYERGEAVEDKNAIEKLFDTDFLLKSIKKQLEGFELVDGHYKKTSEALVRSEFIGKTMALLKSVINQVYLSTKLDEKEAYEILIEKNKTYICLCYDEPLLDGKDIELIVDIVDHALQLFMGHVVNGEGADTIKQLFTGVYKDKTFEKMKNDNKLIEFKLAK